MHNRFHTSFIIYIHRLQYAASYSINQNYMQFVRQMSIGMQVDGKTYYDLYI